MFLRTAVKNYKEATALKTSKRRTAALLCPLAFLCLSLSACSTPATGENASGSPSPSASGGSSSDATAVSLEEMDFTFTDRDLDGGWDAASATLVVFSDSGVTVTGSGAAVSGCRVTLSGAGSYVLSGSCADGQVIVDTGDSDKLQLVLNGLSLTCTDHAPLFIRGADKVFVTLADGTQNTLADSASYSLSEEDGSVDGAVFSRADLTFNGGGSLAVTARYHHGIVSKDDLVFTGGSYTITAADDGLQGKDCVKIRDGTFDIDAGGDGVKSNNEEDAARGFVYLEGGSLTITAATDGIQAETALRVAAAVLQITTGGGSQNASTDSSGGVRPEWGGWGGNNTPSASSEPASAKGLKSSGALLIESGTITADSSDDALHSNGDVTIRGGTLILSSGDDGIHADATVAVSGGDLTITRSYEGIEGKDIAITDGTIRVTASDDGLNCAGGSDGSSVNGRPGQNSFQSGDSGTLRISGGFLTVNALGDGLDSNGSLCIEGGVILVSGPTDSGNSALDYDGAGEISGGVLIAAGSSGMAQGFSSGSAQNSFMYGYSSSQPASQRLTLTDGSGNIVVSFTPVKAYQNVVISAPGLQLNTAYILYSGGTISSAASEGYTAAGTLSGASKVADILLTSASATLGNASGGMGAMGGGMGGGPGRMR